MNFSVSLDVRNARKGAQRVGSFHHEAVLAKTLSGNLSLCATRGRDNLNAFGVELNTKWLYREKGENVQLPPGFFLSWNLTQQL